MKVLDFTRHKKKKSEIGIATKIADLIKKTTQLMIDHDYQTGNIDTIFGIQERVYRFLDSKIKTLADIDALRLEVSKRVVMK